MPFQTGCIAIAAALTEDPPITSIMLSDSDVTPRGAHALAESLRTQCTRTKEVGLLKPVTYELIRLLF